MKIPAAIAFSIGALLATGASTVVIKAERAQKALEDEWTLARLDRLGRGLARMHLAVRDHFAEWPNFKALNAALHEEMEYLRRTQLVDNTLSIRLNLGLIEEVKKLKAERDSLRSELSRR